MMVIYIMKEERIVDGMMMEAMDRICLEEMAPLVELPLWFWFMVSL